MTSNEDARPFVALRQDAQDFQEMFDADIEKCITLFSSKITSLICDPDSLGNPFGEAKRATAQMEFSRSKYDIFINSKAFFDEIEEKWKKRITEMKNLFLENVEIFLANTKLEVKFPSEENLSPLVAKTSSNRTPRGKKAVKNSSTPLNLFVSSLTKNLPDIPLLKKNVRELEDDTSETTERMTRRKGIDILDQSDILRKAQESARRKTLGRVAVAQTPKKVTFMLDDEESDLNLSVAKETPNKPSSRRRSAVSSLLDHNIGDLSIAKETPNKPSSRRRSTVSSLLDQEIGDLDVSDITPSKYSARRKTMFADAEQEELADLTATPGRASRSQSKRKTIGSASDIKSGSSPKRLKLSERPGSSPFSGKRGSKVNLLECDDDNDRGTADGEGETENYTEWMALKSIDGKIPTGPAIYEIKVWRAKKSAFIGSCDNLRQKLTLYKLGQNSGHKHLDKFLERNIADIQVRYETVSSVADAKVEVKNRINDFVAQYKTTPAYN